MWNKSIFFVPLVGTNGSALRHCSSEGVLVAKSNAGVELISVSVLKRFLSCQVPFPFPARVVPPEASMEEVPQSRDVVLPFGVHLQTAAEEPLLILLNGDRYALFAEMVPQRGLVVADPAELAGEGILLSVPALSPFLVLVGKALLQLFPLLGDLLLSLRLSVLVGEGFPAVEGVVPVLLLPLLGWQQLLVAEYLGDLPLFRAVQVFAVQPRS